MIDKSYPTSSAHFDLEQAISEDEQDGNAPEEWLRKMFPELYVED